MTIKDRKRIDDFYSQKARKEKYPARSVWKLEEFDEKYRLFKPGMRVLDLGCAPGSWTLYAAKAVGPGGLVLGLDLNPPQAAGLPKNVIFKKVDLLLAEGLEPAQEYGPFQIILSDLAPKTSGRKEIDQAKSLELCAAAWQWAQALSVKGADFLLKIFQSPEGDEFLKSLNLFYEKQIRLKPKASRKASQEIFVLNRGLLNNPG
ncbi:MAG: RlmE family RNA methyltransferase [Deltaproteobacteria bacterium]|nr:RlmE family RNA methyltransferase [Deltaproteobacteria bacterium]